MPQREMSGREWLEEFLAAQGGVQFNLAWLAFSLGQAAAAMQLSSDPELAREWVAHMETDSRDLVTACGRLFRVVEDMVANAKTNVEARSSERGDGAHAFVENLAAQEAVYWEARRQGMGLTDKNVRDLLRAAAPHMTGKEGA